MKLHWTLIAIAALLAFAGMAYSQDDSIAADDSIADDDVVDDDTAPASDFTATLEFSSPVELAAATEYEFEFMVANTTTVGATQHWIQIVDLYMPAEAYDISVADLMAPDDLHGGEWTVTTLPEGETPPLGIRWEFSSGVSSMAYGDIREGESLDFAFRATTDEDATDGFDYKITADSGAFVSGTAYIVGPSDDTDDDDGGDDDTTGDDAGDDDDSTDSGCGC